MQHVLLSRSALRKAGPLAACAVREDSSNRSPCILLFKASLLVYSTSIITTIISSPLPPFTECRAVPPESPRQGLDAPCGPHSRTGQAAGAPHVSSSLRHAHALACTISCELTVRAGLWGMGPPGMALAWAGSLSLSQFCLCCHIHRFGSQPQWAVCGESFPVGCRFDNHVSGAQFFTVNPDRRRRMLNTQVRHAAHSCSWMVHTCACMKT